MADIRLDEEEVARLKAAERDEDKATLESRVVYSVFYKDYVNDVSVLSSEPGPIEAERVPHMAEVILQNADNFMGIIDKNDLILHAYLDDDEQAVILELLFPEDKGAMRATMARHEAMEILANLPTEFTETMIPNAQFVS